MFKKYSTPLFSIAQTRQIERHLIDEQKISEFQLMKEAGRAVFEILKQNITDKTIPIYVFCGSGNNGGDGYIVAYLAKKESFNIECIEVGSFDTQSAVARKAKEYALKNQVKIIHYSKDIKINKKSIIIDAILGIGTKGNVKDAPLKAIQTINNSKSFIISVDNPSGINCDTGEILGEAVISDITVTLLTRKQGLFLRYGSKYSAKIEFSDLNCNYATLLKTIPARYYAVQKECLLKIIPKRKLDTHKGNYGNVLIVGGDYGMGGAVMMTAMATCKAGAGKVTVLTKKEQYLH